MLSGESQISRPFRIEVDGIDALMVELHVHELQLSTLRTEHCDASVVACLDEIIDVYAGAVGRIDSLADIFLPGSLDDTRTVVGIHAIV